MSSSIGKQTPSEAKKNTPVGGILQKLRTRRIIETLAAFIGGGWLLVEVVERLLVGHYKLPEETIDLTVISVVGALLATLVWRWFRSTEKRPGILKVEVLLVPLIILATIAIDLSLVLQMADIRRRTLLIGIVALCLGIAWVLYKSLKWATIGQAVSIVNADRPSVRSDRCSEHAEPACIRSLAVLPLANLSSDPDEEYFADGVTEELITHLARFAELRVISRTSSMHFKGSKETLPEIAQQLHVDGIVEGTIRRAGDRVRITAQLIHAPADRHLWAKSYERSLGDILALQSEVARAIAGEIQLTLTPQEQARLMSARKVVPKAYELCLRSRQYLYLFTQKSIQRAIEFLDQALAEDPDCGLAYAELALCHYALSNLGHVAPGEGWPRVKSAAKKALELDPTLAKAYTALGQVSQDFDWDWAAAESAHRRAIELMPSDSFLHMCYSWFLTIARRHDESIAEMRLAQDLDPLSLLPMTCIGEVLLQARQSDPAIEQCRRAIAIDATYWAAYLFLGMAYQQNGQIREAVEALEKGAELAESDSFAIAALGNSLGSVGRTDEARRILEELKARRERAYLSPFWIALVHLGLGENEKALDCLEAGFEERAAYLNLIQVYYHFDPVRGDPRFQAIVRKMNLP